MPKLVFVAGRKYLVTYKLHGVHRREHKLVAVFMAENDDRLVFDARPIGGTQTLDKRHFIRAEEVPAGTPCAMDP